MIDIADQVNEFFDFLKIKPVQLTLDMKEDLEDFWLRRWYEDEPIEYGGKTYENLSSYEINYNADQWFGCDLFKYKTTENNLYCYERVAHGEGDSPFLALMAMTIDASNLLDEEDYSYLRQIFEDDNDE